MAWISSFTWGGVGKGGSDCCWGTGYYSPPHPFPFRLITWFQERDLTLAAESWENKHSCTSQVGVSPPPLLLPPLLLIDNKQIQLAPPVWLTKLSIINCSCWLTGCYHVIMWLNEDRSCNYVRGGDMYGCAQNKNITRIKPRQRLTGVKLPDIIL